MRRLVGKCAVVTGGAQGIGLSISRRLAAEGARVAVLDLKPAAAQAALAEKAMHIGLECDVADSGAVDLAFERVAAEFGRIDILVNNAGIGHSPDDGSDRMYAGQAERLAQIASGAAPTAHPDQTIHMSDRGWASLLAVNVNGSFYCARAAIRDMARRDAGGSIVNISSTSAVSGEGPIHYVTSKAAIVGLTRGLAREVASRGIRVNAVFPGVTETPVIATIPEAMKRSLEANSLIGRIAQPDEVAAAVAFLASDDASYATGSILTVNGGLYFC